MSSYVINKQEYIKAGGFSPDLPNSLTITVSLSYTGGTVQRALCLTPKITTRLLPLSMR